jgi:hypothetical protein
LWFIFYYVIYVQFGISNLNNFASVGNFLSHISLCCRNVQETGGYSASLS